MKIRLIHNYLNLISMLFIFGYFCFSLPLLLFYSLHTSAILLVFFDLIFTDQTYPPAIRHDQIRLL